MTDLNRTSARTRPAPPVRAVHLGLGAFHRAHQAVYTAADPDWGIAAYTFRNTELPQLLTEQEGLYSVRVCGDDDTSRVEIVDSISRAHPGGDHEQWLADLSDPNVALVTMTVTEAAYRVDDTSIGDTAIGRLLAGLYRRYRTNGAPLALVPCDNLPSNGDTLRKALHAASHGDGFHEWIRSSVSVADTVVDRITPAPTERDRATVTQLTGFNDLAPVVTEPFSEWLISGDFPLGRPAWDKAGARFVEDIEVYQQRKLRFLNGAHSLLAYTGPALGCRTIDEAVRHPRLSTWMESWWDTATSHVEAPDQELADYRAKLRQRFASRSIRHELLQIAADGSQKLPARILPVLRAERRLGRLCEAAIAALAGWVLHLRTQQVRDPRASELVPMAQAPDAVPRVLAALDGALAEDRDLITAVEECLDELRRG